MGIIRRIAEVFDADLKFERLADELDDQGAETVEPAKSREFAELSRDEQWKLARRMVDGVSSGITKARAEKLAQLFKDGARTGELDVKAFESAAELLPSWLDNKPQWGDWDTERAIAEGLKANVWVYACVYRIAKSVASIPWIAQQQTGGTWEPKPESPLQTLVDSPNPKFSRQTFFERITMHLLVGGNALVKKVRVGGVPVELWPMNPAFIKYTPSRTEWISSYKYVRGDVDERVDPEDVIHMLFEDPSNPYWGMSPMQAASRVIDTDIEATKWNKVALQNRAVADGAFVADKVLGKTQYQQLREQVRDQHQGPSNAREPWVLGGGVDWKQMSLSPVEMDFIESRKLTREEICSVYMMPPPLVGIYDNATLSNIETARRILWEDTLSPLLDDIGETLNLSLAAEFGPNWRLVPDLSGVSVLLAILLDKLEAARKLFEMGVPFDKINDFLDLGVPDFEGSETGYISSNMQPTDLFNVESLGDGVL